MKRTAKILSQVCSTPKLSSFSCDYAVKLVQKHLNSSWKNCVGKATAIILLVCLTLRLLFLFTSIYSPSFWLENFSPLPDATTSKRVGLGAGTQPKSGQSVYSNPCTWSDLSQCGLVKTQFQSSVWTVGERKMGSWRCQQASCWCEGLRMEPTQRKEEPRRPSPNKAVHTLNPIGS